MKAESRPAVDAEGGVRRLAHNDVARILIDRDRIAARVKELGEALRTDLEALGGDVVLVPVMTGALIFVADLIRHLPQKVRISVIAASSYAGRTTRSSGAPVLRWTPDDLADKHVVIVDDILDSGTTIRRIRDEIAGLEPRSIRTCVLLRKALPSARETAVEYVGFDIPDEFVVGYGLDYDGYYRNLPYVGVLAKDAI